MTIAEFDALPEEETWHELSDGELISIPPHTPIHARCQATMVTLLGTFVQEQKLGTVLVTAGCKLGPRTVRVPDLAVLRRPPDDEDAYVDGGPDLVVEIIERGDKALDLRLKVQQYLDAGTSLVWVVYPRLSLVEAHAPGRGIRVLGIDDVLEAPDLLPGLQIPVRSVLE